MIAFWHGACDWLIVAMTMNILRLTRCRLGSEVLLVIFVVLMVTGILLTYAIASLRDDVRAVWPYISDTGNYSPERCIFTLFCCTAALFGFIIVHIYYKHVMKIVDHQRFRTLNYIARCAGFTSAYGLIVVGSFQNKMEWSALHYFGAVLAFGVGSFYCCVVTVISWHMAVIRGERMFLIIVRVFMCFCLIGGIITLLVAAVISNEQFEDDVNSTHDKFHWAPSDKGYAAHVVNTGAEWVVAGMMVIFFLTYFTDFRSITVAIAIKLKENHGYYQVNENERINNNFN